MKILKFLLGAFFFTLTTISLIIAFVYKEQAIHDVAQAMFIASGTFLVFGLITLRSLLKER